MTRCLLLTFFLSMFLLGKTVSQTTSSDSLVDKKVYQKNIKIYKTLLKSTPNTAISLKLADALRLVEKYEESAEEYSKIIDNEIITPVHFRNYSEVLDKLGQKEESERWRLRYKEAIRKQDDLSDANIVLDTSRYFVNKVPFNSHETDFGPVYYKNGLLYISSYSNSNKTTVHAGTGESIYKFYYVEKKQDGNFSLPEEVFKSINTAMYEGPVAFSPLHDTLYLNRSNLTELKVKTKDKGIHLDFVKAAIHNNEMVSIKDFEYNNPKHSCTHPALSADGNELYFASNMDSTQGGTDIYLCKRTRGVWGKPINLGGMVNSQEDEMYPFMSPDGKLYFSSEGHNSKGGYDVFVTERINGNWTEPKALEEPINTIFDDFSFTSKTTGEGFLASNRAQSIGRDDIFSFSEVFSNEDERRLYRSRLISIVNKDYFLVQKANRIKGRIAVKNAAIQPEEMVIQLLDVHKKLIKRCHVSHDGLFSFSGLAPANYLMVYEKVPGNAAIDLVMTHKNPEYIDLQEFRHRKIGYVEKDSLSRNENGLVIGKLITKELDTLSQEQISVLLVDTSGKIIRRLEVSKNQYFIFKDLPREDYTLFTEDNIPALNCQFVYQDDDHMKLLLRSELIKFHYTHLLPDSTFDSRLILHGQVKTEGSDPAIVLLANSKGQVLQHTIANKEGYFVFRNLDAENFQLLVMNESKPDIVQHQTVFQDNDSVYFISKSQIYHKLAYSDSLSLDKTIINGRLTLEDKPMDDRLILLVDKAGKVKQTTHTNSSGYFAFHHLNPEDLYLVVNEQDAKYRLERYISSEEPGIVITKNSFENKKTDKLFSIAGTAVHPSTKEPLDQRPLLLLDKQGKVVRQTITSKEGNFTFENLPPDYYLTTFESYESDAQIRLKLQQETTSALIRPEMDKKRPVTPASSSSVEPAKSVAVSSSSQEADKLVILFPYNSATISSNDQKEVAALIQSMRLAGNYELELSGYADTSGSDAFNLKLSDSRVKECAGLIKKLAGNKATAFRITEKANGKTNQFKRNGLYVPILNRRVEITRKKN